jgi:hypothetical protein
MCYGEAMLTRDDLLGIERAVRAAIWNVIGWLAVMALVAAILTGLFAAHH